MLVIAHRGANREALENSWTAFEKAIEGGAHRIELDARLIADRDVAICHDDDLNRVAGVSGRISQLPRGELARVQLPNGDSLPFLDEVLERLLPRIELNIELKGDDPKLAERVCQEIDRQDPPNRVIVSCFEAPPLAWIRDHAPHIERACLTGGQHFTWPFFSHLSPLVFLELCATPILHPHVKQVNENLMDQAKARGWTIYPWVDMQGEEDDREGLWTVMKTRGVDGLCTNYPRQLATWLEDAALDEQRHDITADARNV